VSLYRSAIRQPAVTVLPEIRRPPRRTVRREGPPVGPTLLFAGASLLLLCCLGAIAMDSGGTAGGDAGAVIARYDPAGTRP